MNTRTERHELPNGFVEVGTVAHDGHEFSAGGAVVTDQAIVVYPGKPANDCIGGIGQVMNWGNDVLGVYWITGYSWAFGSRIGLRTKLTCYRVTLNDGRVYVGRGLGVGMALRARRAKS